MGGTCELDIHVWVKPETKLMARTYTVTVTKRRWRRGGSGDAGEQLSTGPICIDMPIDEALQSIRSEMEPDD